MELRKPSLPVDGILTFEADGATWTLLFGVNALVRLEDEVEDEELERLLAPSEGARKPRLGTYRSAFWAGLRDYHPNLTFEDAGHLMRHVGERRAGSLIMQGILAAMPAAEDGGDKRRPRKAARLFRKKDRA